MSTNTPERAYLLGTSDAELIRLGFQHRVWARTANALWERAGFRPGHHLLDLGCGPGYASLELAGLVGRSGCVVAFDESRRFLDHLTETARRLGLEQITVIQGDVHELLLHDPWRTHGFDGAYARWVLCFLRDPESVVRKVADLLKPGAAFAVQDYFNYGALALAPRSAAMDRVLEAVKASWTAQGGDPDLAGRLPGMMTRAGLVVTDIHPVVRVARPGSALWHWPSTFFANYLPVLVEKGFLTAAEQAAFEADWQQRSEDPASFFVSPPVFDIIGVKPA